MVGRRGEAPLVPPYRLRSPNMAMALRNGEGDFGRRRSLDRVTGSAPIRRLRCISILFPQRCSHDKVSDRGHSSEPADGAEFG